MVASVEGSVGFNPAMDRFNLFTPGVIALQRLGEFRIARADPGPTKLFWGSRAVEVEYQPTGR